MARRGIATRGGVAGRSVVLVGCGALGGEVTVLAR